MKNIADNTDQSRTEISGSYRTKDGKAQIDFGITYRNGYPEYTSSGHFDGSSGQCLDEILAAYPEDRKVKLFHTRWKLHHLKNAEMFESLVRQEAARFPAVSFYDTQAQDFLSRNGLKFRATLSDSKSPAWAKEGEETGHHYRCVLWRVNDRRSYTKPVEGGSRLTFDFWGSIADARVMKESKEGADLAAGMLAHYNTRRGSAPGAVAAVEREWEVAAAKYASCHPSAYDVLACISGDAYTPETFADFCAVYGYESDSIKALQQFRRCSAFAKRLRAFFTAEELTQLSEIR